MRLFFLSILFALIFSGCKKEKPPVGQYWMYLVYNSGYEASGPVEIMESTKDRIVINGSELVKNDKWIKGPMSGSPFSMGTLIIEGKWSHRLFSKNYKIEGEFEEVVQNPNGHYHDFGTFTIKKP